MTPVVFAVAIVTTIIGSMIAIKLPSVATSTIKNTTMRPASSCFASTRICLGRIVEKITPLMMIIQILNTSQPIITRVILSI